MLPLGKIQTSLILHSLNHIFRFVQNATPQQIQIKFIVDSLQNSRAVRNGASSYDTQLRCYDTAQSAYDNYFGLRFTVYRTAELYETEQAPTIRNCVAKIRGRATTIRHKVPTITILVYCLTFTLTFLTK